MSNNTSERWYRVRRAEVNDRIEEGMDSYYDSVTTCHHHYTSNGATWKGIG